MRAANEVVTELATRVKEKEGQIRSYAKRVVDLERKVQQLGNIVYCLLSPHKTRTPYYPSNSVLFKFPHSACSDL